MDDLISRQAAISLPVKPKEDRYFQTQNLDDAYDYGWRSLQRCIEKLPSAQPKRKMGKWVHGREIAKEMIGDAIVAILYDGWQCSECKCIVEEEREPLWNFCPNCGAKMKR